MFWPLSGATQLCVLFDVGSEKLHCLTKQIAVVVYIRIVCESARHAHAHAHRHESGKVGHAVTFECGVDWSAGGYMGSRRDVVLHGGGQCSLQRRFCG